MERSSIQFPLDACLLEVGHESGASLDPYRPDGKRRCVDRLFEELPCGRARGPAAGVCDGEAEPGVTCGQLPDGPLRGWPHGDGADPEELAGIGDPEVTVPTRMFPACLRSMPFRRLAARPAVARDGRPGASPGKWGCVRRCRPRRHVPAFAGWGLSLAFPHIEWSCPGRSTSRVVPCFHMRFPRVCGARDRDTDCLAHRQSVLTDTSIASAAWMAVLAPWAPRSGAPRARPHGRTAGANGIPAFRVLLPASVSSSIRRIGDPALRSADSRHMYPNQDRGKSPEDPVHRCGAMTHGKNDPRRTANIADGAEADYHGPRNPAGRSSDRETEHGRGNRSWTRTSR